MEPKLQQLKLILNEVFDLMAAYYLMEWDQQTYMPPGAAELRGNQMGTLQSLAHARFTSDEVGRLLEELEPYAAQLDPDSNDARLIRVAARQYMKKTRVPASMMAEKGQLVGTAYPVWVEARAENNFKKFLPYLERVVDWRRRYAEQFAPYEHIYDPLLDDYEPGLKTADVKSIFAALRPQQVALIQAITRQPQVEDAFLYQPYETQKQWDFGVDIITRFGFDWKHSRQDLAVHPFTEGIGIDDVRITTRLLPEYVGSGLFSTMHEAGHAMYEMGIDHALDRTTLATITSLGLHESQSRMWENLVGRSRDFWLFAYPRLQAVFPTQLGNVSVEKFYKGINKVAPTYIRVEADEATYNLHIMLRLEIEIALMEGSVQVRDLPQVWNAKMSDYLGLTPPTDSQGVLQDVHWSSVMIGYFPTYALGNLISVQLWEQINRAIPDLPEQIRRGEFSALLGWLRANVHCHGNKYEAQELVQRITGSKIDPAPYMRYLQTKYGDIYGL
jgi:carboxypeptidase Taq